MAGMIYRSMSGIAGTTLRLATPLMGPDLRERLVLGNPQFPSGAIWIHGASVGELNSARAVIAALAAERPVLVTANTMTGRGVATGWGLPAMLAPLDVPQAVARFLDALSPVLAITIENEIWPNRAAALRDRGIPQAVIGARMSARSAKGWGRARGLIAPVLSGLALLSAQDEATEARLLALGLPRDVLAPRVNLKLMGPASVVPPADAPGRGLAWLAASTHPGEEEAVLAAHVTLRRSHPQARLILAPRHPRRADEVAALIAAQGFPVVRLGAPDPDPPVLLIDRLGALDAAYAAAGICLTGGSLADHGGHTPWEPAAWRCALLHGPHTANFAADYRALDAAGAARGISAETLAPALDALMRDDAARRAMGQAARGLLDRSAPDPAALARRLLALAAPGGLVPEPSHPDIGCP